MPLTIRSRSGYPFADHIEFEAAGNSPPKPIFVSPSDQTGLSISERADALEMRLSDELDALAVKSNVFTSGEDDPTRYRTPQLQRLGQRYLMGSDPRLPPMPKRPTLLDFFRYRFGPAAHVLQSATHALKAGQPEKIVLACLLHDISVIGFIRADHGYWAAQLVEPYVDEEVSWAIRYHQALRFYADEAAGYSYPETYVRFFGDAFEPEPHIAAAYAYARNHPWYLTSRMITVNDIYSFDPDAVVRLETFTDIVARNFRQPEEGLGFDASPSAHIWRTINQPTRFL